MQIGFKEQTIPLRPCMLEPEMELYLLQNGYDCGEGICEKGKEHLYGVDSTMVVDHALELGYEVSMNLEFINEFVKVDTVH